MKLKTLRATLPSLSIIGMTPMAAWADCGDCVARCQDAYNYADPNAEAQFQACVGSCYSSGVCGAGVPQPG